MSDGPGRVASRPPGREREGVARGSRSRGLTDPQENLLLALLGLAHRVAGGVPAVEWSASERNLPHSRWTSPASAPAGPSSAVEGQLPIPLWAALRVDFSAQVSHRDRAGFHVAMS